MHARSGWVSRVLSYMYVSHTLSINYIKMKKKLDIGLFRHLVTLPDPLPTTKGSGLGTFVYQHVRL